jgi:broad specificity phosphatase PhoE
MRWKDEYDRLGVLESKRMIFCEASTHIKRADYVFTSSLYRSQHSLALLQPNVQAAHYEIFNEVNFRSPRLKGIRLSTRLWSFISGASWYVGLIKDHETITQVKERAIAASDILIKTSEQGVVALVGHGFFNMYICKELQRRGWKEVNKYSSKNWSCTRLVCGGSSQQFKGEQ